MKIESIRDAISFMGTLPFVDRQRLFGLGVCASGGYIVLGASAPSRDTYVTRHATRSTRSSRSGRERSQQR